MVLRPLGRGTTGDARVEWLRRGLGVRPYPGQVRVMSQWKPVSEAADILGMTKSALNGRGRRGTWPRRRDPDSGDWLYDVSHRPQDVETERRDGVAAEDLADEYDAEVLRHLEAQDTSAWVEKDHYVYNGERDVYVVSLPSFRGQFIISGTRLRSMWRSYTSGSTIAEITRDFGIDHQCFQELKRALRLTHTRAPFTDEELASRDVDSLVAEGIRIIERDVMSKIERRKWRKIQEGNRKWVQFESSVLEYMRDFNWPDPPELNIATSDRDSDHTAIIGTTDLHFGKRPFGADGSTIWYERWLWKVFEAALSHALEWGTPDQFIIPVGSDLFHADTKHQTTTRGTPQGAQSVGSVNQAFGSGLAYMSKVIDALRSIAPVLASWIPGNHDELLSYAAACALRERYRGVGRVTVDCGERRRKTYKVGQVPLMLTHGDALKPADYVPILAREMPLGCDLSKGLVVRGHWHKRQRRTGDRDDETIGVDIITLTSPAPPDDWHHKKGYDLHRRRMSVLRVDPELGLTAQRWATAPLRSLEEELPDWLRPDSV